VFAADPKKFTLVAENRLGEESMASPAVSGNQMFLRVASGTGTSRQEHLYCIG
jgi:outer membrane protein assembly factor BamB